MFAVIQSRGRSLVATSVFRSLQLKAVLQSEDLVLKRSLHLAHDSRWMHAPCLSTLRCEISTNKATSITEFEHEGFSDLCGVSGSLCAKRIIYSERSQP